MRPFCYLQLICVYASIAFMVQTNLHDCKEELRNASLKATPARLGVLEVLEGSNKPLDVGTLINQLQKKHIKTDQVTVFRIMNLFTERGITKQIQLHEGKTRYELTSQGDHHHLVCEGCGDIEDISDCSIDALEKEIESKKKFKVKSHSLEFFGICSDCQK